MCIHVCIWKNIKCSPRRCIDSTQVNFKPLSIWNGPLKCRLFYLSILNVLYKKTSNSIKVISHAETCFIGQSCRVVSAPETPTVTCTWWYNHDKSTKFRNHIMRQFVTYFNFKSFRNGEILWALSFQSFESTCWGNVDADDIWALITFKILKAITEEILKGNS